MGELMPPRERHFCDQDRQQTKEREMYKLLSFDVYGTLVNTPPSNAKAFQTILSHAGAANIDPLSFYNLWESRNIAHYLEPYRSAILFRTFSSFPTQC